MAKKLTRMCVAGGRVRRRGRGVRARCRVSSVSMPVYDGCIVAVEPELGAFVPDDVYLKLDGRCASFDAGAFSCHHALLLAC